MKALVLSGGTGSRLRPFSHSMPKQLIPVANQPVLAHVLSRIAELGVTDVGIVVGDRGDEIAAAIGDGLSTGLRIDYIRQDRPRGLAHCVAIAREFLGDDDFVVYLGDNVLSAGLAEIAEDFRRHRPAAHLVVHKVADPREFGVVECGPDGEVVRLVEKPRTPGSDLALVGVYFFTAAIHRAVERIAPSARGELELTDAVQWLVDAGEGVRATEFAGYWRDTGRSEDVLECNRELLNGLRGSIDGQVDQESLLIGAVLVEPGAQVSRSTIEGPTVIGAGSTVSDSRIGPHTSIGADCEIRGASLEYSIVLAGAAVTGVTGVHASVIGRAAVVTGRRPGVEQHRLLVGDDCVVEIAT